MKQKFDLIALTKEECEGIEDWLTGGHDCIDYVIYGTGRGIQDIANCTICTTVFKSIVDFHLEGFNSCPCYTIPMEFVIDVAITVLEHNGYELKHEPSYYERAMIW